MAFTPPVNVPLWPAFFPSAPVVPKLYYDALSPEQRLKKLCEELQRLCEYANALAGGINADHTLIKELQEAFQRFIDGEYDEYYKHLIADWIEANFADLLSAGIKQVYFGLTDDGYFCAYIPDSWSEITFDTGAVYGRSDYGRLILKFEPDPSAQGMIDNTYSTYTLNASTQRIQQLIADLEVIGRRGDVTYNAMFTNLDVEVSNGNF